MQRTGPKLSVTILLAAWLLVTAAAGMAQTLGVPPRPAGAPTGSQFINIITPMSLTERENWVYAQVVSGNVPDFQRTLVPVAVSATISGTRHTATYYAAPDYLAIGTDADYFLEPTTPLLAQRLCNTLGCALPTRKMVNQIWTNAAVKMSPQPIPPSGDMIRCRSLRRKTTWCAPSAIPLPIHFHSARWSAGTRRTWSSPR